MPRQDVPYGGAICRLKERIAEIWDELGKKLHSINGVEGDAAGDVKIVSGDAAVVVTSDQVNHEIEIALDTSQLPAASVASVNGQTGAVALDAGDIPSDGNSDVQTDIDVNKAAISACSSAITSEQLARQNADATLQTNINTVTASLPAAAAAAVAADPTVAQLVTDMAGKVDLTDVSTVETPDTIAKRNGSGRLVAADPASGATDKTLTTANWISQTGDSGPNNLLHKNGNETKSGILTFSTNRPEGVTHQYATSVNDDDHVKRIIQKALFANFRVKYLVIDSRDENYGIASVIYNNGVLQLTYTAISGTFVPTFRIFEKDGINYIAMDMAYHVGFTLQQLVYADIYGNNIYYSPMLDELSTNYTEVTHT